MEGFNITTECYIRRDSDVLFIHKGRNDMNTGKYLGIGGHLEEGESPDDCMVREIYEETGIRPEELRGLKMRGMVTFINSKYEDEYICLFEAEYTGKEDPSQRPCDEGKLEWVNKDKIYDLPLWEGDREFFGPLFGSDRFFSMKLIYDGDLLKETKIY